MSGRFTDLYSSPSRFGLWLFFCLFGVFGLWGQTDFRSIDRHALRAPVELQQNLPALTRYLIEPAGNDLERVRAIYTWITHHIGYDEEAYRRDVRRINQNNADILRRRRAVCFGYALLFQAMSAQAGLQAEVVSGYSKGTLTSEPGLDEADHAWNAVRIDERWHLLDATWGSSLIDEKNEFVQQKQDIYFLTPPEEFVLMHLPNLPMWQLLDCPVQPATFQQHPDTIRQYLVSVEPCFSYSDSIRHFLSLEPPQRRRWEAEGAYRFNPTAANRENLGHSLIDFAGYRADLAADLQAEPALADSLIHLQQEVIALCERAFSLMTPYQWQKELYVNTLLNQAVALYRQADQKPHPDLWYERALQCVEKSEAMLGNFEEESYFANYALEQCRRMRPVIEEALER